MTAGLTSLTAKMDALRAKGFSDEEINTLLSPVTVAAQPNPLPLSEDDKAYAEQWNESIDTIIESDKKTWIPFVILMIVAWLPTLFSLLSDNPFDNKFKDIAPYWTIGCYVFLFGGALIFNYKQVDRAKFFFKKRVD
jgi:hypothetical protein